MLWFFASDLHGRAERYEALWRRVAAERPDVVLLGGDLLPHALARLRNSDAPQGDFLEDVMAAGFSRLRDELGADYPRVLLIEGNDDPRSALDELRAAGAGGLWDEIHGRRVETHGPRVFGYAYVPPTPFLLKDWERYDVSRFVDPGCVSPEEGRRTVAVEARRVRYATIAEDLDSLAGDESVESDIFLFHTPPYRTGLDRAALDGRMIDHAPLDVHVGSIAVRRFIETRRPRLTLHGHVHESARLTGVWKDKLGPTVMISAAHDGPELALVRFDPLDPDAATRELA